MSWHNDVIKVQVKWYTCNLCSALTALIDAPLGILIVLQAFLLHRFLVAVVVRLPPRSIGVYRGAVTLAVVCSGKDLPTIGARTVHWSAPQLLSFLTELHGFSSQINGLVDQLTAGILCGT